MPTHHPTAGQLPGGPPGPGRAQGLNEPGPASAWFLSVNKDPPSSKQGHGRRPSEAWGHSGATVRPRAATWPFLSMTFLIKCSADSDYPPSELWGWQCGAMADRPCPPCPARLDARPSLTWMACTSRLLSSRAAEAVDEPKEAAPRCSPRMRRPSFLYCSMGSHSRSRNPWTAGMGL